MTPLRAYLLGCVIQTIAVSCLIQWPIQTLEIGAQILGLAIIFSAVGMFLARTFG